MHAPLITPQESAEDREAVLEFEVAAKEVRLRSQALLRQVGSLEDRVVELRHHTAPPTSTDVAEYAAEVEKVLVELDNIRDQQYALVAAALSWTHTPDEVRSWCERALVMGANHPRFDANLLEDLMYVRRVPNAPLREHLEARVKREREDQFTANPDTHYIDTVVFRQAEEATGWNNRILRRRLGMLTRPTGAMAGGLAQSLTLFIDYEVASALARTFGIQPRDAGI